MTSPTDQAVSAAQHWDSMYQKEPGHSGSWYQEHPEYSLRLLDAAGAQQGQAVVDIGGGESRLPDRLLDRGFDDLTVLDISPTSLRTAQQRLGPAAARVHWLARDILTWRPGRTYDLWHDRAVFHFLTSEQGRATYMATLQRALASGGRVVIGTFAADGPEQCSGLPVAQYSPEELAAQFGDAFRVLTTAREEHHTPAGAVQPFTWLVLERD